MEREIEKLFNIEVFSFDEVEPCNDGYGYTNVEFFIDQLKEYDGMMVEVNMNWDIKVWSNEGEEIVTFNIFNIGQFRAKILKLHESEMY